MRRGGLVRTAGLWSLAACMTACGGSDGGKPPDRLVIAPAQPVAEPAATKPAPPAPKPDAGDVLALARRANSGAFTAPDRGFHASGVRHTSERPRTLKRAADRFEMEIPGGQAVPTPTVEAGLVIAGAGRWMGAVREKTGAFVWAVETDDPGPSTVVCEDGSCAWSTESCSLVVVAAASGKARWSTWLGSYLLSSPTIANGTVFAAFLAPEPLTLQAGSSANATHGLGAFDLATGKARWLKWIDREVLFAPVAEGTSLYSTTLGGTVYVFDQKTGAVQAAKARRATSPPVVDADGVHYTRLVERDGVQREELVFEARAPGEAGSVLASGEEAVAPLGGDPAAMHERPAPYLQGRWLDNDGGSFSSSPFGVQLGAVDNTTAQLAFQGSRVLRMGKLSIATMGDEVVALDGTERRWSIPVGAGPKAAPGYYATPPVAAGGRVIVAKLDGTLLVIDPDSGAVLARHQVGHPVISQPAVWDGWIYVGTADGKLVAIDTGDPGLTGWPTAGRDAQRSGRGGPA